MTTRRMSPKQTPRRRLGTYYTPQPIVRFMLRSCFDGPLAARIAQGTLPPSILDPCCGDGAFLITALSELQARFRAQAAVHSSRSGTFEWSLQPAGLAIRCLFGVDLNAAAVGRLRSSLASVCEGASSAATSAVRELAVRNIRVGDALTGPDFSSKGRPTAAVPNANGTGAHEAVHWPRDFPQVAAAGGFDLVIGNPPYRSEKGDAPLFRRLARTALGRRWRQSRMDLWHYFLHRGLDLLRPGGVLCYIVPAYWMAACSARLLRERLESETTVREVILLGDVPVFEGVVGQHVILQVEKASSGESCRVVDLGQIGDRTALFSALDETGREDGDLPQGARSWCVPQPSLYRRGVFTPFPDFHRDRSMTGRLLGDVFEVRQGIAENPPFVTRSIRSRLDDGPRVGSGIFVLSAAEVTRLELAPQERALLRPYYAARFIQRFTLPDQPTHWLLYLTRRTAPEIERYPQIASHLANYRPVLERRREVRRGCIEWWHLHWPREERLFIEPRILAVQMGRVPRFVYVERPAFVGFAVNIILSRGRGNLGLAAATAVLNSTWAAEWFSMYAKRRGAAFDISGTLLRSFPCPDITDQAADQLASLCLRRQQCGPSSTPGDFSGERHSDPAADALEQSIDRVLIAGRPPHGGLRFTRGQR